MTVVVTVESVNEEGKKMVLSSRGDDRIDVTRVMPDSSASDKWVQGVVQGTASFGLFIRPAGMDAIGSHIFMTNVMYCDIWITSSDYVRRLAPLLSYSPRSYVCREEDLPHRPRLE